MKSIVPSGFKTTNDSLVFDNGSSKIIIQVLDSCLIRVQHLPPNCQSVANTHTIEPPNKSHISNLNGIPKSSIHKLFPCPEPQITVNGDIHQVKTRDLTLSLSLEKNDFKLTWFDNHHPDKPFLKDLAFRAYEFDRNGGVSHYVEQIPGDVHYGMGERAGSLVLNNKRFRLKCCDALGYNAETTDPLYKMFPYYLTLNKESGNAFGLFYDSLSSGVIDFGCEIEAFWGFYRKYQAYHGSLDYYVFYGPSLKSCIEQFSRLIGKPALVPKYALGYLASSMGYAEAENAQELIEQFPSLLKKWNIPCDLLHLSSGYTVDVKNGARNVFTWNPIRFKDPKRLFSILNAAGIKTVANVKPWLLSVHPRYQELTDSKGYVWNKDSNSPNITRLWSGGAGETCFGSYIDFSSSSGRAFWKKGVQELLNIGVTGIWNDNNEMALPDDDLMYALESPTSVGLGGRLLQTVLMASASYEALQQFNPSQRPFLITRAGAPGVQRFASQTWSGDNTSVFHTLKYNIPMGLNAGLSLLSGYGHDVGGFVGPRPSSELFVRWVQNGIFHPRFCIHSWKKEGITEPWMYPEVVDIIRDAIQLRYKLIPYLYHLSIESHFTGSPIIRPLIYEFQSDIKTVDISFDFMLGPFLLISSITQESKTQQSVYLPMKDGVEWCDIWSGIWYKGGESPSVSVPLHQHNAVFALQGAIIPTGKVMSFIGSDKDDFRLFWIFPSLCNSGTSEFLYMEDDGISNQIQLSKILIKMEWNENSVSVSVEKVVKEYAVEYDEVWFLLPLHDDRMVYNLSMEKKEMKQIKMEDGRIRFGVSFLN